MRAFMSAGGNRLTAGRTPLRGQVDGRTIGQRIADQGAMAEREARRILAETEPDTNDWREVDWRAVREPFAYLRSTMADVALADALRAFVEGD